MSQHPYHLDGPGVVVLVTLLLLFCWLLGSTAGRLISGPAPVRFQSSTMHSEGDHAMYGTTNVGLFPASR